MKHHIYIWTKIGGGQNLFKKVKKISILNFIRKMSKNGKFQHKIRILVFPAHKLSYLPGLSAPYLQVYIVGGSQKSFQTDWSTNKKSTHGRRPYGSIFQGISKK